MISRGSGNGRSGKRCRVHSSSGLHPGSFSSVGLHSSVIRNLHLASASAPSPSYLSSEYPFEYFIYFLIRRFFFLCPVSSTVSAFVFQDRRNRLPSRSTSPVSIDAPVRAGPGRSQSLLNQMGQRVRARAGVRAEARPRERRVRDGWELSWAERGPGPE